MPDSVTTLVAQNDGALAASAGMDAVGRLWDLRTGRNILKLEGHVKPVLALDFHPNGYQLATGSEDNTARVFDLRKKGVVAVLPGDDGNGIMRMTCGQARQNYCEPDYYVNACLPPTHNQTICTEPCTRPRQSPSAQVTHPSSRK